MNLVCPHCQKMLTASDEFAGQIMKCPHCANTFTAPALPKTSAPGGAPAATASAPSEVVSPPGPPAREEIILTAPTGSPPPETTGARTTGNQSAPPPPRPADTGPPAGYRRTYTVWVSPRVVPWLAPVCLIVVFIFSFFTWLIVYEAGGTRHGENAWEIAFGHGNALLVVYLILFLLALLITLASAALPWLPITLPPAVQPLVPWRSGIVTGAILLAFIFLFLQLLKGFHEEAPELGTFLALRTGWLKLAVTLHLVAAITAAAEFWLVLRKTRPLPRVDVSW